MSPSPFQALYDAALCAYYLAGLFAEDECYGTERS
jgi:hypothetical protein